MTYQKKKIQQINDQKEQQMRRSRMFPTHFRKTLSRKVPKSVPPTPENPSKEEQKPVTLL